MREKLIELIGHPIKMFERGCVPAPTIKICEPYAIQLADHLISNGVTIPVLCKDCHNFTKSKWCNLLMMDVKDDGFCDKGERRTDD